MKGLHGTSWRCGEVRSPERRGVATRPTVPALLAPFSTSLPPELLERLRVAAPSSDCASARSPPKRSTCSSRRRDSDARQRPSTHARGRLLRRGGDTDGVRAAPAGLPRVRLAPRRARLGGDQLPAHEGAVRGTRRPRRRPRAAAPAARPLHPRRRPGGPVDRVRQRRHRPEGRRLRPRREGDRRARRRRPLATRPRTAARPARRPAASVLRPLPARARRRARRPGQGLPRAARLPRGRDRGSRARARSSHGRHTRTARTHGLRGR